MTDDIVARLHRLANGDDIYYDMRCLREAADEIERLRAEVARLRGALVVAETYVDITYHETDREEAGEAKRDLDTVRAALKETER